MKLQIQHAFQLSMKLKSSIIIKKVNDNSVYAIDCESEEDSFFKFEGSSKVFIEDLHAGNSVEDIISKTVILYPDVPKNQIENDFKDFAKTIQEFGITRP